MYYYKAERNTGRDDTLSVLASREYPTRGDAAEAAKDRFGLSHPELLVLVAGGRVHHRGYKIEIAEVERNENENQDSKATPAPAV